jgi:MtN3 and saliva related transmembrane protein
VLCAIDKVKPFFPDSAASPPMSPATIELIGSVAATITTLCWIPQAIKVLRTRDTAAISLVMYLMLAVGLSLWLLYGLLIGSWPLIGSNTVTLVPVLAILVMKLRFG